MAYQGHETLGVAVIGVYPGEGCLRVGAQVQLVGKVPGGGWLGSRLPGTQPGLLGLAGGFLGAVGGKPETMNTSFEARIIRTQPEGGENLGEVCSPHRVLSSWVKNQGWRGGIWRSVAHTESSDPEQRTRDGEGESGGL